MRIFNKFKDTKGFVSTWERVIRFRDMITETAQERTRILAFWHKHGLEATKDAHQVSRRTLFDWQARLDKGEGKLESLNPGSRTPKKKRKRLWDYRILEELRRLRDTYPNLGKEKLYPELKIFSGQFKLICPKPRTIGRLMKDMGGLRRAPVHITGTGRSKPISHIPTVRKPKDFKAEYPGHCVGLDTVEVVVHGKKRYLITCEDLFGRFAFAWATNSHASEAARAFFESFRKIFPYPVTFVLTDNGSEFKKQFSAELLKLQITHYHTYPRTPKMNAHVERFNRTIQEEFVNYHLGLILDLDAFNTELMDWLIWYNTRRVHFAFGNKLSPIQFLLSWKPSTESKVETLPVECRNGWPHTKPFVFLILRYYRLVKKVTKSLEETHALAAEFSRNLDAPRPGTKLGRAASKLDHATLFGMYGDLGSGKTAFVQGVAKAMGIKHHVTSPTFVIQKRYEIPFRKSTLGVDNSQPLRKSTLGVKNSPTPSVDFQNLIHIDAYRFSEGKDMKALRWEETLADPGNIIFLEWPELVESALPQNLIPLRFTFVDEHTREIELPEL